MFGVKLVAPADRSKHADVKVAGRAIWNANGSIVRAALTSMENSNLKVLIKLYRLTPTRKKYRVFLRNYVQAVRQTFDLVFPVIINITVGFWFDNHI